VAKASIRTAQPTDLPGIRFADPLLRADPERMQTVRASIESGQCIVAVDGEDILGYAVLSYRLFDQGVVPLLVVSMANRRCGIGTSLLKEIEKRCGQPQLCVPTTRSNMAAQWMLEKCGYAAGGSIAETAADEDEELVFNKKLPSRA